MFWKFVIKCSQPWNLQPLPLHFNDISLLGMRGSLIFQYLLFTSGSYVIPRYSAQRKILWSVGLLPENKKDGVACRPCCRHTANPAACSIAGRKSWNKTLLSATSLHAANLMLVSARYFIPPPFSGKFFWNSFPENGRRTIATISWREAA